METVGGPAAWRGADLVDDRSWMVTLTPADQDELRSTLAAVDHDAVALRDIGIEDFHLPRLGTKLGGLVEDLVDGRGFVLVRGVPVEDLSERQAELMYWGLSQYVGRPMRQKTENDLLTHVRNDADPADTMSWGAQTSAHLEYHADSADVVGLLCIRPAMSGGISTIVSAVSVRDEIVRKRPDLAEVLHEPWWHDRYLGDGPENFYRCPIFALNESGTLFSHYGRKYLETAQRGEGVPGLTPRQIEALDLVDEITNRSDLVLNMDFAPGDVQFLNNYRIMHARTSYQDFPERDRRRDLIRVWLVLERDLGLPAPFESVGMVPRASFG